MAGRTPSARARLPTTSAYGICPTAMRSSRSKAMTPYASISWVPLINTRPSFAPNSSGFHPFAASTSREGTGFLDQHFAFTNQGQHHVTQWMKVSACTEEPCDGTKEQVRVPMIHEALHGFNRLRCALFRGFDLSNTIARTTSSGTASPTMRGTPINFVAIGSRLRPQHASMPSLRIRY